MKYYELNNAVLMPSIGIGTFLLTPEEAEKSVSEALKDGYRLIDTANAYVNERACGRAIKNSGLVRNDIFVSTKIWPSEYNNPNAVDETLERLGLDYIDLLFLHQPAGDWKAGYRLLEKAYKENKIRAIGISNFEDQIEELLNWCEITPQVIQVECHPFFPQDKLRQITDKKCMRIMSWYPLGGKGHTAELLENKVIVSLANKYHKSPAQIVLKWHSEMGFITIPGSKNPDHIKDNIDIFDFNFNKADKDALASLNSGLRYHHSSDEKLAAYAAYKIQYEQE